VTWQEFKAGAHSDLGAAMRQLALARRIQGVCPQRLSITLRAPCVAEDDEEHDAKIETLCSKLILGAYNAELIDAVEVVCDDEVDSETGKAYGFNLDDASTLLEAAYRKKIPTRLGCERRSDTGAVALAPSFYARCAAYLNFCDPLGVEALAQARTIAMLLPLSQKVGEPAPPLSALREHRVPVAIGTGSDASGSSCGLLRAARSACAIYDLTIEEAFIGITLAGSRVLAGENGGDKGGSLNIGAPADLALWDAGDLKQLLQDKEIERPTRVWIHGHPMSRET
jgi:imidazolonepropionase